MLHLWVCPIYWLNFFITWHVILSKLYSYLGTWTMLHEQIYIVASVFLLRGLWYDPLCNVQDGTATWVPGPSCMSKFTLSSLFSFCYAACDPLWTVQDGTATWVPGPCSMNQSTSLFLSSSLSWQSFSYTRWVLLTLWNNLHKNVQKIPVTTYSNPE